MGRNFVLKYEDVKWDDDPNGEKLKAWEDGKTGYPFIDAGMRQMKKQGEPPYTFMTSELSTLTFAIQAGCTIEQEWQSPLSS